MFIFSTVMTGWTILFNLGLKDSCLFKIVQTGIRVFDVGTTVNICHFWSLLYLYFKFILSTCVHSRQRLVTPIFSRPMASSNGDPDYNYRLSFLAEWFDFQSTYTKKFLMNFYPCDNTVELFDRDTNRIYLKRSTCEKLDAKDVFVGNTVRLYGRQVKIKDYADCKTKCIIGKTKEHTIAILKPHAVEKLGEVITQIEDREFQISRLRMCNLLRKEALDFYESKKGEAFLPFMVEYLVSGPIVALELVGDHAIERWKEVVGPTDPQEARKTAPTSLRAIYGMEKASNAFHAADNHNEAVREACFFFPQGVEKKPPPSTAQFSNSTCCVIKPHVMREGKLGYILSAITDSNFKITAMRMLYLNNANAEEFLEVYKRVVSDFHALLLSFLDGPCVALEISGKRDDMDVHQEFRKFAGPSDSQVARQIRPNTLRALFGDNKYNNAVHCTDLPEDTELELEYFFKLLDHC